MELYVECPICEQQFAAIEKSEDSVIICPSCSRSFPISPEVSIQRPLTKSTRLPIPDHNARISDQVVAPASSAQLSEFDSPENSGSTTATIDHTTQSQPSEEFVQPEKHLLESQIRRRGKRRLLATLTTFGILTIVIGILATLLVIQLQKGNRVAATESETATPESLDSQMDTADAKLPPEVAADQLVTSGNENTAAVAPETNNDQTFQLSNFPPQEFEFLKKKTTRECWESIQQNTVSLIVHDATGTHEATGTIVDSRGWILTSYSSIASASRIEVTASAKSISDLPDDTLLTDDVRGIIASDAEHDLALLTINRRFVVSLAPASPIQRVNIVQDEHLIQCCPPSESQPYSGTETEIVARETLDNLDPSAQSEIEKRKLDSDTDLDWFVTSSQTMPPPGTPILKEDGTFSAMHVFSHDNFGYAIPVDRVQSLIDSADEDDIKPIRSLGGTTGTDQMVSVADNHPMRERSVRLNKLGEECSGFDWIPKTEEQYKTLQQFARGFTQALIYIEANNEKDELADQVGNIINQTEQWSQLLTEAMSDLQREDLIALRKMNEFAKIAIKQENEFVPFYGRVHSIIIEAKRTLLLFDDNKTGVSVRFESNMQLESEWLFFVQTSTSRRPVVHTVRDQKIEAELAEIRFAMGPMN